jgi:hypothetical protein
VVGFTLICPEPDVDQLFLFVDGVIVIIGPGPFHRLQHGAFLQRWHGRLGRR